MNDILANHIIDQAKGGIGAGESPSSKYQVVKTQRTWRSIVWDHDTDQKSPEEKRLLTKIDVSILVWACVNEFLKLLDQQNISNAYISGLKEDINLGGNKLNTALAMFQVGYAIGQVPGTLLLQKYRPSQILPLFEVAWAVATFGTSAVKTPGQLCAARFFVGLAESAFFPGMLVTLAAWYTPAELGKRTAIFFISSQLGQFFSGYLQASVVHLDGVAGRAGWRWLFIVDGALTLPLALFGYFIFPDTPARARSFWMSDEEKQLAQERVARAGKQPTKGWLDYGLFKRAIKRWHWWWFVPCYVFYGLGTLAANTWFGVWLQSEAYSIYWRNILPTFTNLVTVITCLMWGWLSDYFENRPLIIIIALTYSLFPLACLSVWDIPKGLKLFSYLTLGVEYITPIIYVWANEVCRQDDGVRSFVVSSMNAFQYAFAAWVPIVIYPASKAPRFSVAYQITASFNAVAIILVSLIWHKSRQDERRGVVHKDPDYQDDTAIIFTDTPHHGVPVDQREGRDENEKEDASQAL